MKITSEETRLLRIKYEKYLENLKYISSNLLSIYTYLKNAETNFFKGGYISDGETLDQGELKKSYEIIEADIDILNNVISKTSFILEDLE